MTRSRPFLPWRLAPLPAPPLGARQCLRLTMSARLSVPARARMMTLPPSPPSPPSGPPLGTYFSRRKLQQPLPPSPPLTKTVTRSTNISRVVGGGLGIVRLPGGVELGGGHLLDRAGRQQDIAALVRDILLI